MSIITASRLGPVMFYLRWRVLNSVCARRCLQGCTQLVPSGVIGNRTPWKSYINAGFNGKFIFKWWIVHFSTFDYWLLDGNGLCNCKATSQIGWCIRRLVCPSDMVTSQHWLCCFPFPEYDAILSVCSFCWAGCRMDGSQVDTKSSDVSLGCHASINPGAILHPICQGPLPGVWMLVELECAASDQGEDTRKKVEWVHMIYIMTLIY
jgi:hypothetical protein